MLTEKEFQESILADPGDEVRWLFWADWLEENGASDQAEIIRLRSELTRALDVPKRYLKEARLCELVYEHQVEPPIITPNLSIDLELVLISPGSFRMGSPESEVGRDDDEAQVIVTITKAFWIGKYPVTQGQYSQVMGYNPSHFEKGLLYPVEMVSYEDALLFCRRLTQLERDFGTIPLDWEFTLPTEAQWEYACRSGSSTAFYFGDNEMQLVEYAWYGDPSSTSATHPVGQKCGNSWRLHDMHGNVWEWCLDWYQQDLLGGPDPRGPITGLGRVNRGGGYSFEPQYARSAYRSSNTPEFRLSNLGFRLVLIPAQPTEISSTI